MDQTGDRMQFLIEKDASIREWVEAIRALPYGRPSERTVAAMLREQRGTCSTKHLYLAEVLQTLFPESEPKIVHRVYQLDRETTRELYGERVAILIPDDGLVDVHRYLRAFVDGHQIVIDATFPGEPWDGRSSMPLACGQGQDFVARLDPDSEKRALENQYCDHLVREPFIEALGQGPARPPAPA